MLKKLGFIVLLSALSCAASAGGRGGRGHAMAAPEFDLGAAGAALTLALGGFAVLRARRVQNLK